MIYIFSLLIITVLTLILYFTDKEKNKLVVENFRQDLRKEMEEKSTLEIKYNQLLNDKKKMEDLKKSKDLDEMQLLYTKVNMLDDKLTYFNTEFKSKLDTMMAFLQGNMENFKNLISRPLVDTREEVEDEFQNYEESKYNGKKDVYEDEEIEDLETSMPASTAAVEKSPAISQTEDVIEEEIDDDDEEIDYEFDDVEEESDGKDEDEVIDTTAEELDKQEIKEANEEDLGTAEEEDIEEDEEDEGEEDDEENTEEQQLKTAEDKVLQDQTEPTDVAVDDAIKDEEDQEILFDAAENNDLGISEGNEREENEDLNKAADLADEELTDTQLDSELDENEYDDDPLDLNSVKPVFPANNSTLNDISDQKQTFDDDIATDIDILEIDDEQKKQNEANENIDLKINDDIIDNDELDKALKEFNESVLNNDNTEQPKEKVKKEMSAVASETNIDSNNDITIDGIEEIAETVDMANAEENFKEDIKNNKVPNMDGTLDAITDNTSVGYDIKESAEKLKAQLSGTDEEEDEAI